MGPPQGIGKLDILRVWQNSSEGQGTVIAAMITVIAALGGVILGRLLFSGRVRNLETALKASEGKVQKAVATDMTAQPGADPKFCVGLCRITYLGVKGPQDESRRTTRRASAPIRVESP
jgi:hypothetical protein